MFRCLAILAWVFLLLAPVRAQAQFITLNLDVQNRARGFTVDRCYVGNIPLIRFYLYQNGEPFITTNHHAFFKYGTNSSSPFMVSMSGETSSSNRVDIVGTTNTFTQARNRWFCELILVSKTNNGFVTTFSPGNLIVDASPGSSTTNAPAMGLAWNWGNWTNYNGIWPFYSTDTQSLSVVGTPTGLFFTVIAGGGTITGVAGTNGITGGGASGSVTMRVDTAWLIQFLSTNAAQGTVSNVLASGGLLSVTNDGRQWTVILDTATVATALSQSFMSPTSTLSGDLTGPLSNAQIAAGAVGMPELASGAVSNAQISTTANIDPSKVLGVSLTKTTAFAGVVSGVFSNLGLVADSVVGSNIAQNTIGSSDMATSAVSGVIIADSAISNVDISATADIDPSKVLGVSLTKTTAFAGVVSGVFSNLGLVAGAVVGSNVAADAITSAKVQDSTLTTSDMVIAQFDAKYMDATGETITVWGNLGQHLRIKAAGSTNFLRMSNQYSGAEIILFSMDDGTRPVLAVGDASKRIIYYTNSAVAHAIPLQGAPGQPFYLTTGGPGSTIHADLIDGLDGTDISRQTNFDALNSAAVTITNPRAQRVLGDLHGASFISDQGVVAACTNCAMSTNMLVNGDFAQGGSFWAFSGGANSNSGSGGQMIVAGNTSGTAVQSNQFAATPGTWILSYTNTATDATGSITVAWGGVEHTQVGPLTGYVSWPVGPRTTNGFSISASVTGSTSGAWKNFTLKQVFSGDVTGVYGSFTHLAASNARIAGSLTAGTISGTASGYVAKIGDTMTGTLVATNSAGAIQVSGSGTQLDTTNNTQGHIINGGNGSALYSSGYILWTKSTNLIYLTIKGSNAPYFARLAGGLNPTVTNEIWDDGNRSAGYTLVAYNAANLTNSPVPGPGTVAPITNARCAGCSIIMDTGATSAFWGQISASVTGVTDVGVTVTHSPTNYPTSTNLLGTLAGIDSRLGSKIGTSNDSVTSAQIQGGAIGNAEMAAGAVAESNIVANSIGASRFNFTNAHAAGYVPKSSDSNTWYWAADDNSGGGTGSQSPWTNTIDAAGKQLIGVGSIIVSSNNYPTSAVYAAGRPLVLAMATQSDYGTNIFPWVGAGSPAQYPFVAVGDRDDAGGTCYYLHHISDNPSAQGEYSWYRSGKSGTNLTSVGPGWWLGKLCASMMLSNNALTQAGYLRFLADQREGFFDYSAAGSCGMFDIGLHAVGSDSVEPVVRVMSGGFIGIGITNNVKARLHLYGETNTWLRLDGPAGYQRGIHLAKENTTQWRIILQTNAEVEVYSEIGSKSVMKWRPTSGMVEASQGITNTPIYANYLEVTGRLVFTTWVYTNLADLPSAAVPTNAGQWAKFLYRPNGTGVVYDMLVSVGTTYQYSAYTVGAP